MLGVSSHLYRPELGLSSYVSCKRNSKFCNLRQNVLLLANSNRSPKSKLLSFFINFFMSSLVYYDLLKQPGLSVRSLHVLPVYAWVLSGYSGFLPPSKNMHVMLIGDSKFVPRSECERAWLFVLLVTVWPCDGLATCPGFTLPLAQ